MFTVEGSFETALNSEWRDQALHGRKFGKHISYDYLLLFENVQNLYGDSINGIKTEKMFFVFKITGFD